MIELLKIDRSFLIKLIDSPYKKTLVELAGRQPYTINKSFVYFIVQNYTSIFSLTISCQKLSEICNTIERCWDVDSDARLSAHCVLVRLSSLVCCNCERDQNIVVCTPQQCEQSSSIEQSCSVEQQEQDPLIVNAETVNKDPEKGQKLLYVVL